MTKRLCTICARGGSKGVKGKNIRPLLGVPLIGHTIACAKASGLFECVAVSSDSPEIRDTALALGCDYVVERPAELASDTAPKLPAIRHCVEEVEARSGQHFETFVDLDATSPLRLAEDIIGAVALLEDNGFDNVITAMPARRSPYFNMVELTPDGTVHLSKSLEKKIFRRQDAPACYDMNASIYVWRREVLFSDREIINSGTHLFVMPEDRSIDIDSELDFRFVEFVLANRQAGGDLL